MKEYPTYERGELEIIYSKLSKPERKIINEFIDYCSIGAGQRKLEDIKRSIVQFRHIIGKRFDNIDLKSLRDYLALLNKSNRKRYTCNGVKTHIKRFLRWRFKDWSERFEELKDIRTQKAFNYEKINEGTLLSEEDIQRMIKTEPRLIYKTFLILLWESGARPIELRNLLWKSINFNVDGDLSEIHIFSTKTKQSRTIYVKESTRYLQKLKERSVDSDLVFPSPRNINQSLKKSTISLWFRDLSKKSIGRECFPYLCRHSKATQLYLNNPKVASKFLGHKKDMSDLYTHLSSQDIKESLLKTIYKIEEDLPPKEKHRLEKEIEIMKRKDRATKRSMELLNARIELVNNQIAQMELLTRQKVK